MNKQTFATIRTDLLRSALFLALLFLVIHLMPRALGQRQTSNRNPAAEAPRISNGSEHWRLYR